jgi:hypothetical protein
MGFLRNFFADLFSRSPQVDQEYEPHNSPFRFVFTGYIPKCFDGKFQARIGELSEHEGRYLIFPHNDAEWLMFMFVAYTFDDFDAESGEVSADSCNHVNTALPAAEYVVTTVSGKLVLNKIQGNNAVRIDTEIILPDSWGLKFSIEGKAYSEDSVEKVIVTKDHIAYLVSDECPVESAVQIHEIRANQETFDYVRWEDGSISGYGCPQLVMMEIEMMLPEDIKENYRHYWRPE